MSEKVVNEDYLFGSSHIPREEVEGLVAEAEEYEEISDEDGQTDDECDSRIWYNLFGTNTSTNDTDWQGPDPAASGWGDNLTSY
ncbi:hypothetical protein PtB15_6B387 [Puccinia triticina]|nr:hypothetical protein PtB15_6B387 [Puccinia triticina]